MRLLYWTSNLPLHIKHACELRSMGKHGRQDGNVCAALVWAFTSLTVHPRSSV